MPHQGIVRILEDTELCRLCIGDLQAGQEMPRGAEGAGPAFALGVRVEGWGSRVEGLGVTVEGRGSRVEGRGSRVEG